jgi:hypothetical protein
MECTPWQQCGKAINFHFFWYEFAFKYHKMVGCYFWQLQGRLFTAKSEIGTPYLKRKVPLTPYQIGVGLDPIYGVHSLAGMWKKNEFPFFFFFWYEFVFKYHTSVGCNFWQPQGNHFTAVSGIGTPPQSNTVFDALPNRRGP